MNYIRHLNGFFTRLTVDCQMTSYHISLYLALFQQWNAERFADEFIISRREMMDLSRIGSANTYARCMKELAEWGYIRYIAASNIHSGSRVSCIRFDTTGDTTSNITDDTGIKNSTAADTRTDTTADAGTLGSTENDTAGNITGNTGTPGDLKTDTGSGTATDTGIKSATATDTGGDTSRNTGIPGCTENDTGTGTTRDTGITTDLKTDTGRSTADQENHSAGIQSDTGTDTASDTLLINNSNRTKQGRKRAKENQKESLFEKGKNKKRERGENSGIDLEEKPDIPDFSEVSFFFHENQFREEEASKFFNHYLSVGWKTGNQVRIQDWQALARKWMINSKKFSSHERQPNQIGAGRFSVPTNKDYSEPL